jgi:hypothetical protein
VSQPLRRVHSTRRGRGRDLPKKRGSTKKVGALRIEEYSQRRRETIMKYAQTRNIYGKCKSSRRKLATYFGGRLIIIAMTLQRLSRARRPTVKPPCMPPASTHALTSHDTQREQDHSLVPPTNPIFIQHQKSRPSPSNAWQQLISKQQICG